MLRSARAAIHRALDYGRLARYTPAGHAVTARNNNSPVAVQENWFNDTADVTNIWETGVSGTGTAAIIQNEAGKPHMRLNCPAGADSARLNFLSNIYLPNLTSITNANERWRKLVIEWVARLGTVANISNADFIMGLLAQDAGSLGRDQTNNLGFVLATDVLKTLTDAAGTETLTTVASPPTLTNWNKYRITMRNGAVDFSVNGSLKNTHTDNLPTFPLRVGFKIVTDAAVASKLDIGPVAVWLEE